jgi:Rieske Fe-S protein
LPPPVAASFTQQASEQQQAPARVEMQQQAAPQAGMQQVSEPIQQQPGMLQASGQMQAQEIQNSVAAWWSLDDNPLQPAPEARPAAQPEAKVSPAREPAAARNEAAGQVVSDLDWMAEPVRPRQTTKTVPARSGRRRSQSEPKVKRRSVIALLATGGVVAAGAAVAINLGHFGSVGTKNQTKAPTTVPAKAQMKTQSNTQATAGHTGNVIGSKTQAVNSAVAFTDSANNTAGLLVHLPQGEFVAYERACTHVGVLVNYDPATHMFVCPAHGAIFDPANGGAVIQGPAQLPLPKIGVQVNGDGTVTMV